MERKVKFAPKEYYHLYSRGVEKRKIFLDKKDYERFLALLYAMNQKSAFHFTNFLKSNKLEEIFNEPKEASLVSIVSYTLMPNHIHLVVYEHTEGGISKFMGKLLTAYSMYFNTKYERSGPLFTHPFRSEHISNEAQYLWIFSYVHLNPVGLIEKNFKHDGISNKNTAENFLKSYRYSSYIDYTQLDKTFRKESKILDFQLVPSYISRTTLDIGKYAKWFEEGKNIKDYP